MTALYVENDPYCAQWLRNLISAGLIAPGLVDDRDIRELSGDDCRGFRQVHLFAGIGLWSLALRAAGVGDGTAVWTGSCPCQPFSIVGPRTGFEDARHLWPEFCRLIGERRPPIILGEQVTRAPEWIRLVRGDLEAMEYTMGCIPIEAACAGARHRRDRYWFGAVADAGRSRFPEPESHQLFGTVGVEEGRAVAERAWRRPQPGVLVVADGHPGGIRATTAIGNAIDPRPAAAFIATFMEAIKWASTT